MNYDGRAQVPGSPSVRSATFDRFGLFPYRNAGGDLIYLLPKLAGSDRTRSCSQLAGGDRLCAGFAERWKRISWDDEVEPLIDVSMV